jgi:hypothetical protein
MHRLLEQAAAQDLKVILRTSNPEHSRMITSASRIRLGK